MYNVYVEIVYGMILADPLTGGVYSYKYATEFWSHFLLGTSLLGHGDYVEIKKVSDNSISLIPTASYLL